MALSPAAVEHFVVLKSAENNVEMTQSLTPAIKVLRQGRRRESAKFDKVLAISLAQLRESIELIGFQQSATRSKEAHEAVLSSAIVYLPGRGAIVFAKGSVEMRGSVACPRGCPHAAERPIEAQQMLANNLWTVAIGHEQRSEIIKILPESGLLNLLEAVVRTVAFHAGLRTGGYEVRQ